MNAPTTKEEVLELFGGLALRVNPHASGSIAITLGYELPANSSFDPEFVEIDKIYLEASLHETALDSTTVHLSGY